MTLIICVKTYVKLGLLKEIGVVTLVCLIYVPDVKGASRVKKIFQKKNTSTSECIEYIHKWMYWKIHLTCEDV